MYGFSQLSNSETNHHTSQIVIAIGAATTTPVKKYVLNLPSIGYGKTLKLAKSPNERPATVLAIAWSQHDCYNPVANH